MKASDLADVMMKSVKKYVEEQIAVLRQAVDKEMDAIRTSAEVHSKALAGQLESLKPEVVTVKGEKGDAGESPKVEDIAAAVLKEIPKMLEREVRDQFAKMEKPQDGKPGQNGKDALDLQVEPTIDPDWVYERGTYARYKGGLWKAYENTDGMKGWECIVEGIENIHVEMKDDRTVSIVVNRSSGEVEEKAFRFPVMIYRDVYKIGDKYEQGDVVTRSGSMWVATKDTDAQPGTSTDWKLSVKAGRDASTPVKLSGVK